MTIPYSRETVVDNGGPVSAISQMPILIGVSSGAVAKDTLYIYSSLTSLIADQVAGPLVEEAAFIIKQSGGPVGVIPGDPSVAADNSAITKSGAGPVITVAGDAYNDHYVFLKITKAGALGVAQFQYSLDGFDGATDEQMTFSAVITVPSGGIYVLPNTGLTLTFPAGTYELAETYEFAAECASLNAADLAAAFVAAANTPIPYRSVDFVTSANSGVASAHATLLAALQAELSALANVSIYRRGIIAADQIGDDAACLAAYASVVADRCLVAFGDHRRIAAVPFDGYAAPRQNNSSVFAMRAAGLLISTDLKRVKSGALDNNGVIELIHDEELDATGLNEIKLSTLRTYRNRPGKYITQGFLKSANGSSFRLWPHGIIMDIACEYVHFRQIELIGQGIRVNTSTGLEAGEAGADGTIDERDAIRIEESIAAGLAAILQLQPNAEGTPGHVSDLRYKISRTHNLYATSIIISTVGLSSLAYVDGVETDLGYALDLGEAA